MSLTTRVGLLAGATALTLTGVSTGAPATQGDDLAQRLAAAEAKIAAMEAANNQNWMTEQRAAEIKGLVQDVLADADTRASLLQAGMNAGYDNGFVVSSADGNWLLRTNFLMQQRFIWSNQRNGAAAPEVGGEGDRNRYGFENTRSKLMLSGHVVNRDWFYRLDVNFGTNSLAPFGGGPGFGPTGFEEDREGTLNAYLGHDFGNGMRVMVGSMKLPFMREELVEAQYQLAVERSILNYGFTTGYSDGVAVSYTGDMFRVTGMFSDGFQMNQTLWSAGPLQGHAEYAFTGRAEFMAMGEWDQFNDFTSSIDRPTGLLIGVAGHYERGEYGLPVANPEFLFLTGDVSFEMGGLNLFGAVVWSDIDPDTGAGTTNPWGFLIQAGYNFMDDWEVFGRYEWSDLDITGVEDLSVVTVGVNKYYAGHNAKMTLDVGYGFNGVVSPAQITGWRPDAGDNDGQWVIRTQLQLLF
jgi:hypothetical protein